METLKVAMVGGWSSTIGFKAVGIETYIVSSAEEAPGLWDTLPLEKYAMVIMTEPVFEVLRDRIPDFPPHEGLPVVLAIPAVTGSLGVARSVIRERIVKALGSVVEG